MRSKETIKHHMYKNAARLWDIKNVDNLDPLVKLLMEALSSEIYKLSNDINGIEIRLLERIAQLLTPDMLIIPQPSHMIINTQPVETTLTVDDSNSFLYDAPLKNRASNSLNFRPIGKFSLVKGSIKNIICANSLYSVDAQQNKEIVARCVKRTERLTNCVWVGLDIDKEVSSLKNLSFFVDFSNLPEHKNDHLPLLPFTKWTCKSNTLKTESGIHVVDRSQKESASSIFTKYNLLNMLDRKIMKIYDQHFITIKNELANNHQEYEKLPSELQDLFKPETAGTIESPLLWVKIQFPPNFDDRLLNDINVSINAFPVANKQCHSLFSKSKMISDIIPLDTLSKEYFLAVSSVRDDSGNKYEYLPYKEGNKPSYGTYTIKRGGAERFDKRDAMEYISNLVDLLRDESVAFALLGKDYLTKLVDDMKTKINVMEQKLYDVNNTKEVNTYLVVDSEDTNESLFIDYWVTNCEYGNNIRTGTMLNPDMNLFVEKNSTISLTKSFGGRSIPKSDNKLDMYKYILTSRDSIFTMDDVVNYCYCEFGDYFSNIEVKQGVQVSSKPKEGLIRTIDVFVDMKANFGQLDEDQHEIKGRLMKILKEKSPETFNYRIFIQNKQ